VEAIAEAKAEIFTGLVPGGTAVINRDNPHFETLRRHAEKAGARVVSFGQDARADVRARVLEIGAEGTSVEIGIGERVFHFRVGVPGIHIAMNALAVAAAIDAAGADVEKNARRPRDRYAHLPGAASVPSFLWATGISS
jgi:UDP-N-acetylmuramoyl-tripeptide--D-alanyl-D-alanine ligase